MAITATSDPDRLLEMLRRTLHRLVGGDERELTARQIAVLLICYHESEPQTVRELAEKLKISRQIITKASIRLEKASLLRRKVDRIDGRKILMTRTATGNAFIRELKQLMATAVDVVEQGALSPKQTE